MSEKRVVKESDTAIGEVSCTIAKEVAKILAPEELDKLGIVSEEYLEWLSSHPSTMPTKDQRLGFGLPEVALELSAAAIFAVIFGVLYDFWMKRGFIKVGLTIENPDETIKILGEQAYRVALNIDLDKAHAKQLADHIVQTLSDEPRLLIKLTTIER